MSHSHIPYTLKFSPGETFRQFCHLAAPIGQIFIHIFFVLYMLMIMQRIWHPLPHWRNFIPSNISAIQRYLGLAKFLSSVVIVAGGHNIRPHCCLRGSISVDKMSTASTNVHFEHHQLPCDSVLTSQGVSYITIASA